MIQCSDDTGVNAPDGVDVFTRWCAYVFVGVTEPELLGMGLLPLLLQARAAHGIGCCCCVGLHKQHSSSFFEYAPCKPQAVCNASKGYRRAPEAITSSSSPCCPARRGLECLYGNVEVRQSLAAATVVVHMIFLGAVYTAKAATTQSVSKTRVVCSSVTD